MAYRTQSLDTSEESERVQFDLLRRFSSAKRLKTVQSLSRSQLRLAWSGLRRANPQLSERELQIKAVELWYGAELSQRLKAALEERGLDKRERDES